MAFGASVSACASALVDQPAFDAAQDIIDALTVLQMASDVPIAQFAQISVEVLDRNMEMDAVIWRLNRPQMPSIAVAFRALPCQRPDLVWSKRSGRDRGRRSNPAEPTNSGKLGTKLRQD